MKVRKIILEEGNRIHLKNRNGMFTVVKTEYHGVYISCRRWIALAGYPEIIPTEFVSYSDVKCLAGGINAPRNPKMEWIELIENGHNNNSTQDRKMGGLPQGG